MSANVMNGTNLEEWLAEPDCPQCGSEDVVCTDSYRDNLGRIVKVWYCNKCGHTWTEVTV